MTRPIFKTCPTCGSRRIKAVEGVFYTTLRGKRITVPDVRRHECPACGEILLDYDAVKQIEQCVPAARRKRKTATVGS